MPYKVKTIEQYKQGVEHPWELTAAQWDALREEVGPGGKRNVPDECFVEVATIHAEVLSWMTECALRDARSALKDAEQGIIQLHPDRVEEYLNRLNTRVTHQDVVAWAVGQGMKVPENVLREFYEWLRNDPGRPYCAGDKVFLIPEKRLATVLSVYGDGVHGHQGEIRLDVSGNTLIKDIEHYDPSRHAEYDSTFIPIKDQWRVEYNIHADVPVRADDDAPAVPKV